MLPSFGNAQRKIRLAQAFCLGMAFNLKKGSCNGVLNQFDEHWKRMPSRITSPIDE